jgi:hypothetical protein
MKSHPPTFFNQILRFSCNTITCNTMRVNDWLAVFGPEAEDKQDDAKEEGKEQVIEVTWCSNDDDDDSDEQATEDSITEDSVTEDPVMEEPMMEEPLMEEPVMEEPVMEEPVIGVPEVDASCDPNICRMTSGICVDCTRCSRHCTCSDSDGGDAQLRQVQQAPVLTLEESEPPVCDPSTCRQLICGDCSRCTEHCVCNWEYTSTSSSPQRLPLQDRLVNTSFSDAYIQVSEKQVLVYGSLQR